MAASLEERLLAGGMSRETARQLALLERPGISFTARPSDPRGASGVGVSRLGGLPDVAAGFDWPRWKERPLAFLGQVNLADVASFSFCSVLPSAGTLSFFYDSDQETWGYDPKDRGSWLVHFEPNPAALQPLAQEAAPVLVYPTALLAASQTRTFPAFDSHAVNALALSRHDLDIYSDALEHVEQAASAGHQLLGHAAPVQGEMQLECQLASNGIYCGDGSGYQSPRARELSPGAGDWQLLLQVDSDDAVDMMWGDCGRLYFWLTNDALRRRAFSEAWLILQCF